MWKAVIVLGMAWAATSLAIDECDLTGQWRHRRPEIYAVTAAGKQAGEFHVVAAGCQHCAWHSGTLQLRDYSVSVNYDIALNETGTVSHDCATITWADKTKWIKGTRYPPGPSPLPPRPPPPPPPGAIDPRTVHTVLVMQSCHLDVGFADFSTNIINRFWHQHFPKAIDTARLLKQRGGPEQLVFAVHPMLLSLFFDCPSDFPHLHPGDFPSSRPFATMTTPEPLLCPNSSQITAVKQAIANGVIVFDAFPVSAEPEIYSAGVFTAGLDLVRELAATLNVTRPRTLSQRDVPGLSRAVVPLLAKAGVHTVSIGANGGSASPDLPGYDLSRDAALSTPFLWQDLASGSSVVAHWHPGGYGRLNPESGEGVLSSCIASSALPGVAMCLAFRGDNAGPPEVSEVETNWKQMAAAFPNATTIKPGKFDDYFEQLQAPDVRSKLPVVTSEVGDSWLYGCGSDPLKVQTMALLARHHDACIKDGDCVKAEPHFRNFQRLLVLAGKHTWGGHTIIMDDGTAKDSTHYTEAQLREVRWSTIGFITQEISWNEQRLQLNAIRTSLGAKSMLGRAIDAELAIISGPAAMGPLISPDADASEIHTGNGNSNVDSGNIGSSNGQWHVVDRAQWGSTFTLNKMKLAIDPSTGAIISLQTDARHFAAASNHSRAEQATTHPQATRDWASSSHPIARFAYVAHDAAQAEAFFGNYSFGCPRCGWAKEAFTKPGVTPTLANASITFGTMEEVWERTASSGWEDGGSDKGVITALAYRLSLPAEMHVHYGAPSDVYVELAAAGDSLNVTLRWVNKTTTRLPESLWLEVRPDVGMDEAPEAASTLRLSKMGSFIDPNDVVANGSSLHAVDSQRGVVFTRSRPGSYDGHPTSIDSNTSGGNSTLRVVGLDTPLVSAGKVGAQLNLWHSPTQHEETTAQQGVAYCLFNNLWNTNYVYWYPWRNATETEDDAISTFRWTFSFEQTNHIEPAHQG